MNLEKSLQTIKNSIVKNEEILKVLRKSHPHLNTLSEKQILDYFNVHTIYELHDHITQIQESQDTHNNHTVQKNEICCCTDSNGQIKDLYDSEISAKEQINKILKEKRVQLSIYICPYGCGWHLTKG